MLLIEERSVKDDMTRQQRLCLIWTQRGGLLKQGNPPLWHVMMPVDMWTWTYAPNILWSTNLNCMWFFFWLTLASAGCWLLAAVMLEIIYNIVMWHVLILCSVWPLPLTSCSAPAQHRTNISVTSAIICADTNNIVYHLHPSWQIYKLQSSIYLFIQVHQHNSILLLYLYLQNKWISL